MRPLTLFILIACSHNIVIAKPAARDLSPLVQTCQEMLKQSLLSQLQRFTKDEIFNGLQDYTRAGVFRLEENEFIQVPGLGNLRMVEINRRRDGWASNDRPNGTDPVGSPYSPAAAYGGRAALFFGFGSIDDKHKTIPDASFANHRLDKLDRLLIDAGHAPTLVRFFETDESIPIEGDIYIQKFMNDLIPLERTGTLGIHDVSYHLNTFLIPQYFLEKIKLKVRADLELAVDLKKIGTPEMDQAAESLIRFITLVIDGIANINMGYTNYKTSALSNEAALTKFKEFLFMYIKRMVVQSPGEALLEKMTPEDTQRLQQMAGDKYDNMINDPRAHFELEAETHRQMNQVIEEYDQRAQLIESLFRDVE